MLLPPEVLTALRGRRTLLLGSTGFIGRWLALALAEAGAQLHLAGRNPERLATLAANLPGESQVIPCDLAVPGSIATVVAAVRPEFVFNLAVYGVVARESDEQLGQKINVDCVSELATALQALGSRPPLLVQAGSALEYGRAGGNLREDGPAEPTTWYGQTKLAATRLLIERSCAGLPVIVARLFTVYGPGERHGRLLPSLLDAAHGTADVPLTAGTQLRDFTHVDDAVEGVLRLTANPAAQGQVVNVATGQLHTVREFVVDAAAVLGIDFQRLQFGRLATHRVEMEHEPVSIIRLRALTGWSPAIDPATGVRQTLAASKSLSSL